MNSLAKLQVSMFGFLVLVIAAFLVDILLLVPAVLFLALQFFVMRDELKREYPEDRGRYSAVIVFYEVVLLALFYMMRTAQISLMDPSTITNLLFLVMFVLLLTVAARLFVNRKYCYGTVIFTAEKWVGVELKSDLFSKISEAVYAVENPLKVRVKRGDRVRVGIRRGFGKSAPYQLEGIVR